jgi:hypothetical protein
MITEDGDFYVRWCPVSSRLDEKAESNPLARWSRLGKLDAYGKDNTDVTESRVASLIPSSRHISSPLAPPSICLSA